MKSDELAFSFKVAEASSTSSLSYKTYLPCIMCVQYIGGSSVHRGVFSTSGDTMSTLGDTMSTSWGYHEYIVGCSVHRRDTMSTSGDIMSTLEDVQYIGGIS